MQSEDIINSLNKSLTSDSCNDTENEFIGRLLTYIDGQKWIKKPLALSPPISSQYGWKCIRSDLLECVTCCAKLSVHEPKIENYKAYKACIEKLKSDLKDNHGKHCPWPLTPSPENFVKMIVMPKEEALSHFLKRLKSTLSFSSSIPQIKESVFNELDFNDGQIISLCKMGGISNEEANRLGKSIVSLSATGWCATEGSETGKSILKCDSCQRSMWPGSFSLLSCEGSSDKVINAANTTKKAEDSTENGLNNRHCKEDSDEPPTKRKRISFVIKKGEPFDPLHEHRPWCLWIDKGIDEYITAEKNEPSNPKKIYDVPGWKIFRKSLLRNISDLQNLETCSPSKEQIRNVKNLLETWTSIV